MLTRGSTFPLRTHGVLIGFLAVALPFVSTAAGDVGSPDEGPLQPGCGNDCELLHVSGDVYEPQPPVIATPIGTTYSVSHRVGADLDGNGPQPISCFYIFNFAIPGAPDDIVNFDGVLEPIRTDLLGTIPTVIESDTPQPNGRRLLTILTKSPNGTDLFPGGFSQGVVPLTDACFSIGLEDQLTWAGSDSVLAATIEFLTNDVVMAGPFDAISFFDDPWDGEVEITFPGGSGNGYNGVRLVMLTEKAINLPNDNCAQKIEAFNGDTAYSTIGASTDGPNEPTACHFFSYSQVGSDIWYNYTATCTGNVTVDLCSSNYDTKVAVYDGCDECPVESPPLACNDDSCGNRSFVTVPAVNGQCFTIRIGGYLGVQGSGTLKLSCNIVPPPTGACCDDGFCLGTMSEEACQIQNGTWFQGATCPGFACPALPPANDVCSECARVLTGVPFNGRTRGATGTDISSCSTNDSLDAWNCWTADCTGRVTISTCGSTFDTTLAVYNACGGVELACDDDGCPTSPLNRSRVTIDVIEGTTYAIRVSGFNGASGEYTLNVETCKNACCFPSGQCALGTPAQCDSVGGTLNGPGSLCGGDLDGDGINDVCEPCPMATIAGAAPTTGTVDARQPNSLIAPLPRQGIGSPGDAGSARETIIVQLNPREPNAEGCFDLCETQVDPLLGENMITSVTYHGVGIYELVLDHAITAGGVTTIEFLGDGSFIEFISHPGNVDPVALPDEAGIPDVMHHIDCCLSGLCQPIWGAYSCDINRSTLVTPADTLTVIDLLNGTQVWNPWLGTQIPTRGTTCP